MRKHTGGDTEYASALFVNDWMMWKNFGKFSMKNNRDWPVTVCVYFRVCKQQLSNTVAKFWLNSGRFVGMIQWMGMHVCNTRSSVCVCVCTQTYITEWMRQPMQSTTDNRLECVELFGRASQSVAWLSSFVY